MSRGSRMAVEVGGLAVGAVELVMWSQEEKERESWCVLVEQQK